MAPIPGPIANLVPSLEGSAAGNYFPNLKLHFFEMKNFQISKFPNFLFFSFFQDVISERIFETVN